MHLLIRKRINVERATKLISRCRWLYFVLFCLNLILLPGCTPVSYPTGQVIPAIKKLCKEEYNLDVQARIVGATLGVCLSIPDLVDQQLRFSQEAGQVIEHVALVVRRVILSTDRPIDFYIVCARDRQMLGLEYVLVSYTMDLKRVSFWDISRGQYLSRIRRALRFNPELIGQEKINNFFQDLNTDVAPAIVLSKYAHFPISTEEIRQLFYPTILLAEQQKINYQIESMKSKQISEQQALFWVKVKEHYQPKPTTRTVSAAFPSGFINQYLILLKTSIRERPIAKILPKFFPKDNTIRQRNLEQIFAKYDNQAILDYRGLPQKEIKLGQFLAEQISRRLKKEISDAKLQNKSGLNSVSTTFADRLFKLSLDITGEEKQIFQQALKLVAEITHGYHWQDFAGVEISSKTTGRTISTSQQELEQLRQEKITIEQLL